MYHGKERCEQIAELLTSFTLMQDTDLKEITADQFQKILDCLNALVYQADELLRMSEFHRKDFLLTKPEMDDIQLERNNIKKAIGFFSSIKRKASRAEFKSLLTEHTMNELRDHINIVLLDIENEINYRPLILHVKGD